MEANSDHPGHRADSISSVHWLIRPIAMFAATGGSYWPRIFFGFYLVSRAKNETKVQHSLA